jgi:hypothetical protein
VFPGGEAVMIDRGVRRVTAPSGTVTYQLQGNGWRFGPGHSVRIEIAQDDDPYLKASNVPSSATLTGVTLEIPVRETQAAAHPRPGGGTPLRVALVPAYLGCSAPTSQHAPPLALGSCSPPERESSQLTTGTIGQQNAFARLKVQVGDPTTTADEADVAIVASATDVRRAVDGADYSGTVLLTTDMRLTDRANGFFANDPGTVEDFTFGAGLDCVPSASVLVGSTCNLSTTADSLLPGLATEGKRAVVAAFSFAIEDAGPDGDAGAGGCPLACGTGDEATYLRQGLFGP